MKPPILLLFITLFLIILQPGASDPDDQDCLTQLYTGFANPTLKNWTKPNLANPCYDGYNSYIVGITCNNGRVIRLSLPNSNLAGTISPSLIKCSNLQTLDLSSNSLTGDLPPDFKSLSNLAILNLSNNRLTGQIPATLYMCAYLNVIDLHGNRLVGPIPEQLGLLTRLSRLDLSFNRLSGIIPPSIGNRSGNLPTFNATSFEGNKELYGYPLEAYRNQGSLSVTAIVMIGLGSGFLSLVISFTIVCVWLKVSEHKMAAAEEAKISHLMPDY